MQDKTRKCRSAFQANMSNLGGGMAFRTGNRAATALVAFRTETLLGHVLLLYTYTMLMETSKWGGASNIAIGLVWDASQDLIVLRTHRVSPTWKGIIALSVLGHVYTFASIWTNGHVGSYWWAFYGTAYDVAHHLLVLAFFTRQYTRRTIRNGVLIGMCIWILVFISPHSAQYRAEAM